MPVTGKLVKMVELDIYSDLILKRNMRSTKAKSAGRMIWTMVKIILLFCNSQFFQTSNQNWSQLRQQPIALLDLRQWNSKFKKAQCFPMNNNLVSKRCQSNSLSTK